MTGTSALQNTSDDLADRPAKELIWNREPDVKVFFHYTDRTAARAIVGMRKFRVSGAHPRDPGLFVTLIQPGQMSSAQLLNSIFDGTRDSERTQATVALADRPLSFTRIDEWAWHHEAPVGTVLSLRSQILGWAAYEGGRWMHSHSLFAS